MSHSNSDRNPFLNIDSHGMLTICRLNDDNKATFDLVSHENFEEQCFGIEKVRIDGPLTPQTFIKMAQNFPMLTYGNEDYFVVKIQADSLACYDAEESQSTFESEHDGGEYRAMFISRVDGSDPAIVLGMASCKDNDFTPIVFHTKNDFEIALNTPILLSYALPTIDNNFVIHANIHSLFDGVFHSMSMAMQKNYV